MTDELTHQARFESLRSGPGSSRRNGTERRRIWATHLDLIKQCNRTVRGIERDTKLCQNNLRMKELQIRRTADKLKQEREKLDKITNERHALLDGMEVGHSGRVRPVGEVRDVHSAWTLQIECGHTQVGHHKPLTLTKPNYASQRQHAIGDFKNHNVGAKRDSLCTVNSNCEPSQKVKRSAPAIPGYSSARNQISSNRYSYPMESNKSSRYNVLPHTAR